MPEKLDGMDNADELKAEKYDKPQQEVDGNEYAERF
jgi:hypothetical protein